MAEQLEIGLASAANTTAYPEYPPTPSATSIELLPNQNRPNVSEQSLTDLHTDELAPTQHLPPADRGWKALSVLFGCFLVEGTIWGFCFSFGVLQEYLKTHKPFSDKPQGIAIVGTTASGIMYTLALPLLFYLGREPARIRQAAWIGLFILVLSLVGCSFATNVPALMATQGVAFGIGGSLVYPPAILYLQEWFVRRRGFAYGIMWSATGVGGLTIPLIMTWCLEKWGFAVTMRIWACTIFLLVGPAIFLLRPRLPITRSSGPKKINRDFLKHREFWVYTIGNISQGLGFFIPGLYLPGSAMLSVANATSTLGQIALGFLSDRIHVTQVILISCIGSSLSIFMLWGFSYSMPLLVMFAILYGFFGGGFTSSYAHTVENLATSYPTDRGLLFGLFSLGRGIGAIVSGPLSEALLSGSKHTSTHPRFAYDGNYASLIIFTGVTTFLGSVSWATLKLPSIEFRRHLRNWI